LLTGVTGEKCEESVLQKDTEAPTREKNETAERSVRKETIELMRVLYARERGDTFLGCLEDSSGE